MHFPLPHSCYRMTGSDGKMICHFCLMMLQRNAFKLPLLASYISYIPPDPTLLILLLSCPNIYLGLVLFIRTASSAFFVLYALTLGDYAASHLLLMFMLNPYVPHCYPLLSFLFPLFVCYGVAHTMRVGRTPLAQDI